jgi:small subunit ribosomal protein S1
MSDKNTEECYDNMAKPVVETDRSEQEESFESLLEKSKGMPERLAPGQKVRAKVVSISGDLVYIDLGGKSEGIIDLHEFVNKDGVPCVREGDEINAFFVSVQDGSRKLTTRIRGYSAATLNEIRSAFESGIPVSGEVKREVKGGFEVTVGEVRCFCPFSQIDLKGGREGGIYMGRTFPFKVLEYEEDGRNVIVSRRALLEEEKKAKIALLRETLEVGMEVPVTVSSTQHFGVFVDLGGVDGLIPASELSWDRSDRPGDLLSPGQHVTAKILSLDWDNTRITLSLKAMQPDPWANLAEKFQEGSRTKGKVVRLVPFGAFVNLEPGIDGLIHISNFGTGRRISHPREVVEVGQEVEAYVYAVDLANKKISLSMQPKAEPKKVILPGVGEVLDCVVEKVMPYGVFLRIKEGLTGLVPNSEMGTPVGTDHKKMFPAGTAMKVTVIDADAENNKVRLSRKAVMDKEVEQEYSQYKDSVQPAGSSTFGNLGDLIKAKMAEKQTPSE